MTNNLQLNAENRNNGGKGVNRRLRDDNQIPAVIYGAGKEPQSLILKFNEVIKALENEEYFSQIITLNVDNKPEQVVLKDLQRHPYKPKIIHMDFMRIKASEKITMLIPLHFIGEDVAPGVKQGGIISHSISEVEIKCLPADLPKNIEVDMSNMELNDLIHLSDLKLPKGVELTQLGLGEEYDQPVATIHMARIAEAVVTEEEVPEEEKAEEEKAGKEEEKTEKKE
jgi:large subunit ribosomal protein L25